MKISLCIPAFFLSFSVYCQPLVHLHTNKQTYTTGEKVWLSVYLSDSVSGKLLTQTHPLYLQLFDSDGVLKTSEILYTNKGRGFGYLPINRDLSGGIYRIRAFTKTMFESGRQYEKKITIQSLKDSTIAFWNEPILSKSNIEKPLKISILPTKYIFDKRERVEILMKVTDANGQPQQGTFSISVSDLRNSGGQDSKTLLQDFSQPNDIVTSTEIPEKLIFSGKVVHEKSDEGFKNVELIVMGLDSAKHFTRVVQTDSSGCFQINDLQIEGEQSVNYQVNNRREKSIQNAIVKWDNFPEQQKIPAIQFEELAINTNQKEQLFRNIQKPDGEQDITWDKNKTLAEVEIRAKREIENEPRVSKLHLNATYTTKLDSNSPQFGDINDLLISGAIKGLGYSNGVVKVFGTVGRPLILIDGIIVSDLNSISPGDIYRIDVLNGADAAIYGSAGKNGVIALYTGRRQSLLSIKSQTKSGVLKGYQIDKTFYNPDYSNPSKANGSDNRLTLYWNPEVITNENGEALISFYTSDVVSNFQIMAEGVTNAGVGAAFKMIRIK